MDEIVVVVLADLHLGSDFDREAELPPLEHPGLARLLRAVHPIERFFRDECVAHDQAVLAALPRYLTKVLMTMRSEGFKGDSFDLFLLLGDLVTWPGESAFEFARQYLTRETVNPIDDVAHCAGLKVSPDRIIAVPGNHDKLLQRDLTMYHRQLLARLPVQEYPEPRHSYLISRTIKNREFLFIVVDANIYQTDRLKSDHRNREHLAKGDVSGEIISQVVAKLERVRNRRVVDEAELRNYADAVKILLLHYAVDYGAVLPGVKSAAKNALLPHSCRGASALVDALKNDVRLVMHGHLHRSMVYRHEGVSIISVTSASQRGAKNGFFLLRFSDADGIRAEHHTWARTAFRRDDSPDLTRPV